MTYSMTGYGKETANYKGRLLTVEVRTLNSKQADLNLRIPSIFREKEFELRDIAATTLNRGKIDIYIQRDLAPGESATELNEPLVASYYHRLKKVESQFPETGSNNATDYLNLIMKMPEVLSPATKELDADEYDVLREAVINCLKKCQDFRSQEGAKLSDVLADSVRKILSGLTSVEPMEEDRIRRIRERISTNLSDEVKSQSQLDEDRFEQELIYYLEKLDITEEKVRLKAHCDFFLKTLEDNGPKGKKLSFISQEMGREINTLGSKAQHSDIQRLVVGMKDELEKIKEQVLNVL
ncbi:YicC family protein [Salibacteraceae bacterium]|nr:YicC family protein [Salibacteraceae bacterium]